jgi:hypothetical protein
VSGKLKSALSIGALIVVVIVLVTIVALGKGVEKANKQAEHVAPLMLKVRLGWSEAKIQALLGKPGRNAFREGL